MLQIYDNTFLDRDGMIHSDVISNSSIPKLRELLWVSELTYIGITIDGNLYSFDLDMIYTMTSPIKSGYVSNINQLVLLLNNGKLRIIYIDKDKQPISVNSGIIDRDISIIQPIDRSIVHSGMINYIVNYSAYFLAVTTSNEFLIVSIRYNNSIYRDGMLLLSQEDNPYTAYLNINDKPLHNSYANVRMRSDTELTIVNNLNIDHRSIRLIRSGHILTYDNRVFYIESDSHNHFILKEYNLDYYDLRTDNIVDILVRSGQYLILLTNSNRVLLRSGDSYGNVTDFVYRYNYDESIKLDSRLIEVLMTDGSIHIIN